MEPTYTLVLRQLEVTGEMLVHISWHVFLKVQLRDINGAFAVVKISSVQEVSPYKCSHCCVGIGTCHTARKLELQLCFFIYCESAPWQPVSEECPTLIRNTP